MTTEQKLVRSGLFFTFIAIIIAGSFALSSHVASDSYAQSLVESYGSLSVFILSFVAGLNLFLPVPAATFVPIFTAGGMSLSSIIILLIAGTMTANLLAFAIGHYGYALTRTQHSQLKEKVLTFYREHKEYLPYFIFCFTAFIPLPDEVFLIPLALIGVKLRTIIIPLFLGTIVYQTLAALGFDNIFRLLNL